MTDLQSLISRLEKAEKPTFVLDIEIHALQLGGYVKSHDSSGVLFVINGMQHAVSARAIPAYTASLDAAVGLVTEGWRWSIQQIEDMTTTQTGDWYYGHMEHCADLYAHGRQSGKSKTPAIALCIAALKAQASEES